LCGLTTAVEQLAASCEQTFNRLSNPLNNRFDSRLNVCSHDAAGCSIGCSTPNRDGGALLYVKSVYRPVEHVISNSFKDSVWCKIGTLLIGVCYRSTNLAIVGTDNNEKLCDLMEEVSGDNMLVMGDFNFSEINWNLKTVNTSATTDCINFFETIENSFLSQHVLHPTRGKSVLDLILTRDPDLLSNIQIIDHLGHSDHNMVLFSLHHAGCYRDYAIRRHDYQKGEAVSTTYWQILIGMNSCVMLL